ncbi:hypothetical protein KUTeg_023115, partial [Tegillarca granosa]
MAYINSPKGMIVDWIRGPIYINLDLMQNVIILDLLKKTTQLSNQIDIQQDIQRHFKPKAMIYEGNRVGIARSANSEKIENNYKSMIAIACGLGKIDLVFLIDCSTSIGENNFKILINVLSDFLNNADIDSGTVRVGVSTYSTFANVEFQLKDYTTLPEVQKAIHKIQYRYGSTNTADALSIMHEEMFTFENGDRGDVQNIAILITDGVSNINSRRTIPEAEIAKSKNIHIYTIGIGLSYTREIEAISSVPASENVFTFKVFDELYYELQLQKLKRICS